MPAPSVRGYSTAAPSCHILDHLGSDRGPLVPPNLQNTILQNTAITNVNRLRRELFFQHSCEVWAILESKQSESIRGKLFSH
jgi:hypothetical protein